MLSGSFNHHKYMPPINIGRDGWRNRMIICSVIVFLLHIEKKNLLSLFLIYYYNLLLQFFAGASSVLFLFDQTDYCAILSKILCFRTMVKQTKIFLAFSFIFTVKFRWKLNCIFIAIITAWKLGLNNLSPKENPTLE